LLMRRKAMTPMPNSREFLDLDLVSFESMTVCCLLYAVCCLLRPAPDGGTADAPVGRV
jgi:hypothetical protein